MVLGARRVVVSLVILATLLLSAVAAVRGSSSDDAHEPHQHQGDHDAPLVGRGVVGSNIALPVSSNGERSDLLFRVMPLGDSISICCNYCAVPAGVLTRKDLHEPPTPWHGYIRPLWLKLKAEEQRQLGIMTEGADVHNHDAAASHRFRFSYVGRVVSCMVNRSDTMRVPDDWEIHYEGYYGYTTGRVLQEIIGPALAANDPDVVLLMLGTNDLIQAKAGGRLGRVGTAIQNLKKLIEILLTTPRSDPSNERSRHVFVGKIPPIWFNQIKAVAPAARKPHRVLSLNREIDRMVEGIAAAQHMRFQRLEHTRRGGAPANFLPTVTAVDMFTNMSVSLDLHGDGLHPNANGEAKISAQWFHALGPLMAAPNAHYNILMAQNDDALLEATLRAHAHRSAGVPEGGGSVTVAPAKWRSAPHIVLDQPAALFAEQPTHWDGALFPVVVLTILVYGVLVCRPTQRMVRLAYAWSVAQYTRWSRTRSAVA